MSTNTIQTGIDQFDDATGQLLQQDDEVDALTDFQVMDVWARGEFCHQVIKANEKGGNGRFMLSDTCKQVEQFLAEGNNSAIYTAALQGLGREHPVTQSLGRENGPGNVKTLFDRLTEDAPEAELVEWARRRIKETLRGSGMARIKIMRQRVDYHLEDGA
jgi:hypothetical protein